MPKSVPKSIQTCFEHVLGKLFEKFLPSFPWKVESSKFFKKIKKFSKFQNCPKSFPKISKRALNLFWVKFFENFFCPVFRGGSSFRKFSKKIFSKFQKCPKVFPKVSKRVLNMFWGKFLKYFISSVPWRVASSKIFKKIKKISKFQKCPKSFPKVSKRVLNMFWGKPSEKFLPSFPRRVESSKIFKKNIFKIPKMPKSVPKSLQTCFGVIFSKKVYAQCSMEARDFEKFQKNQKLSKFEKCPKLLPKVSKRVLNVF